MLIRVQFSNLHGPFRGLADCGFEFSDLRRPVPSENYFYFVPELFRKDEQHIILKIVALTSFTVRIDSLSIRQWRDSGPLKRQSPRLPRSPQIKRDNITRNSTVCKITGELTSIQWPYSNYLSDASSFEAIPGLS